MVVAVIGVAFIKERLDIFVTFFSRGKKGGGGGLTSFDIYIGARQVVLDFTLEGDLVSNCY